MSIAASIGAGIIAILIAWGLGDFSSTSNSTATCTDNSSQRVECQQDATGK